MFAGVDVSCVYWLVDFRFLLFLLFGSIVFVFAVMIGVEGLLLNNFYVACRQRGE